MRARDWPLWLIEDLIERPEVPWKLYAYHQAAYYAHLDRREFELAVIAIDTAEVECCQFFWSTYDHLARIRLERAFILGFLRRGLEVATQLIDEAVYSEKFLASTENRARAALLAARGELDKARHEAGMGAKLLLEENPVIQPNIQAELDWLDWIFEIAG